MGCGFSVSGLRPLQVGVVTEKGRRDAAMDARVELKIGESFFEIACRRAMAGRLKLLLTSLNWRAEVEDRLILR